MTNLAIFLLGLISLNVGLWLIHPAAAFTVTGTLLLVVWAAAVGLSWLYPSPPQETPKEAQR